MTLEYVLSWRHNTAMDEAITNNKGEAMGRGQFSPFPRVLGRVRACRKQNDIRVAVNSDFWSLVWWFAKDFHPQIAGESPHSFFTAAHISFYISIYPCNLVPVSIELGFKPFCMVIATLNLTNKFDSEIYDGIFCDNYVLLTDRDKTYYQSVNKSRTSTFDIGGHL